MPSQRPSFQLCSTYDGTYPVSRWLKKFEYEVYGHDDPAFCLKSIDMLLSGNAANWAETNYEWKLLLDHPNRNSLERAKELLLAQFPSPAASPPDLYLELKRFRKSESLTHLQYYQKALSLLMQAGGRDQGAAPLSSLEASVLTQIKSAYLRGLPKHLQPELIRFSAANHPSLCQLYERVEQEVNSQKAIKEIKVEGRTKRSIRRSTNPAASTPGPKPLPTPDPTPLGSPQLTPLSSMFSLPIQTAMRDSNSQEENREEKKVNRKSARLRHPRPKSQDQSSRSWLKFPRLPNVMKAFRKSV